MNFMLTNATVNALDACSSTKESLCIFVENVTGDRHIYELSEGNSKKFMCRKLINYFDDNENYSAIKQLAEKLCDNKDFSHFKDLEHKEMLIERAEVAREELIQVMMKLYYR